MTNHRSFRHRSVVVSLTPYAAYRHICTKGNIAITIRAIDHDDTTDDPRAQPADRVHSLSNDICRRIPRVLCSPPSQQIAGEGRPRALWKAHLRHRDRRTATAISTPPAPLHNSSFTIHNSLFKTLPNPPHSSPRLTPSPAPPPPHGADARPAPSARSARPATAAPARRCAPAARPRPRGGPPGSVGRAAGAGSG